MSKEIEKGAIVKIIMDDEEFSFTYQNPEKNLIDAALEEDIDAPFSCMAGVCSSCRAKLMDGEVIMDATHSLTEEEIEDGFILVCQSKPATASVVISFDDI